MAAKVTLSPMRRKLSMAVLHLQPGSALLSNSDPKMKERWRLAKPETKGNLLLPRYIPTEIPY